MKSYVYILPLEDGNIFKIGKSNEVDIRMNTLSKIWGKFDLSKVFALESDTDSVLR